MKRYFVILALILICQAGNSQTMNQLFNEFSKIEQINHVKIGNITMKLASLFTETMGVNGIEVLEFGSCNSDVKQRFEKAVSGMYLGDILKATFPLEEFEEKFDAQKLTSIMNYPDIYKEVYVEVAQWIYGRSAQLVAASLTGLIMLLKSYNKNIRKICLVAEGSLFWSKNRKDKNYNMIVMEKLRELFSLFGLEDVEVDIKSMNNANLIGTGIAALS